MAFLKEISKSNFTGKFARHVQGKPILEVKDLTVRYDNHLALDRVTFDLQRGERVAVVGPNGAGKSTLFKVIAGVLPKNNGSVRVAGEEPEEHICIAYVPQRSSVDWQFPVTVADVVMMGRTGKLGLLRRPRQEDRLVVQRCLEDVGLQHLAGRQISELSGGQQQRMFIARALAQEAELMLMDEPLNGIDVHSQEQIFAILDELRRRQVTIMVATHDLDQAAERFDRVMLLNHRIVGFGLPGEVFKTENLVLAFGGQLRLVADDNALLALGSTCCDEGGGH